jgi:sulfur carrier protein
MKVAVNGDAREVEAGIALTRLVALAIGEEPGRGVAIAVNGEMVRRAEWQAVRLAEGDAVEIVRATQGG